MPEGGIQSSVMPKIAVFGVGGAGGNVVNNMILSQLSAVKFITANTDCQSLSRTLAETKIQLGVKCTKGLGAGSNPVVGRQAAEEALDDIKREITDMDMLFIAAGMGGGTGTGAAPIIAKAAKDMGILTVAIVIKPFAFEGRRRAEVADAGIKELEQYVDTLIVIDNARLSKLNNVSMADNYSEADSILCHAVYCVVDILAKPGFINRDFADVRTVLSSMGRAMIGFGEDTDARIATETAISNQIIENGTINGAKNILINITGSKNITQSDIQTIIDIIEQKLDKDHQLIFGMAFDEEIGNKIRVSVIAAGMPQMKEELKENKEIKQHDEELNEEHIEARTEEQKKPAVIEDVVPIFPQKINEEDLENDCDIPLLEEIATIDEYKENIIPFQKPDFPEVKKKMNKKTEETSNSSVMSLFDNEEQDNLQENKQKKGGFRKFLSSLSIMPEVSIDSNLDNSIEDKDQDDFYNTPAISRKKVG